MLNKTLTRILLSVPVLLWTLSSCTVKEDRIPCPCYLNVDFEDRESVTDSVALLGWRQEELFRETILAEDHDPYWIKAVHKGELVLSAYRGATVRSGHYVDIAPGSEADSLYAFHDEVIAEGDMVYSTVAFHKQFCTVFLDICKDAAQMKDFFFYVTGNTCGFDLLDFSPIGGTFRCEPAAAGGERVVRFRIPRQIDDSMVLTVFHQSGDGKPERIGDFPLGRYIRRTGYDWNAVDLQDVYITIDLVLGQLIVSVEGWEEGATFKFIEQ